LNLSRKLHRITKLPPAEAVAVAWARVCARAAAFFERFSYSAQGSRWHRPAAPFKPIPILHLDVLTAGFGDLYAQEFPEDAKTIVAAADRALDLTFDLLGSGPVSLKGKSKTGLIPWHMDFKSDYEWNPDTFFTAIRYSHEPGVDVKVPWELSRVQHFVTLGQAYRLTGDEKYARGFYEQWEDWATHNPVKYGVNWVCAMDVALRASNFILAAEFFRGSPSETAYFKDNFAALLFEHGLHIRQHLEYAGGVSTNHYLSNLLGLVLIGLAVGEDTFVTFAMDQLEKQSAIQIRTDGFDYEASTAYHRLVLEMFFLASHALTRAGKPVSNDFNFKLYQMFDFLRSLCRADGTIPLVGDNDSGRVLSFGARSDGDMRALINWGAMFFKSDALKVAEWQNTHEMVWLYGFSGQQSYKSLPGHSAATISALESKPSGLYTLRGEQDYLLFNAQPNGTRGVGNHTHNDKLSFVLSVGGDDFFVDPGMPCYTSDPEKRNLFRSTPMHNTVRVDGQEHNNFMAGDLFSLNDEADVIVEESVSNKKIQATLTSRDPILQRRTVERGTAPLAWSLVDMFDGFGTHRIEWNFILGPDIRPEKSGDAILLRGKHGTLKLTPPSESISFDIKNSFTSPAYGRILETKSLRFSYEGSLPYKLRFDFIYTQ
jgi:hypothetical protein